MRYPRCYLFQVLLFVLMPITSLHADVITLVADQYPPYNDVPGSDRPGYVVEIARHIFTRAGHDVRYIVVPWARAIEKTREGEYTGIIANFYNDAPDFIFPEEEVGKCSFCFFAGQGTTWQYAGITSLKGKKLGVIRGYTYTSELDPFLEDNPDVDITFGEDALEKNIKKLLGGRIDLVIEDKYVFLSTAERIHVDAGRYRNAGALNADQSIYIAFSPKNPGSPEYARLLSEGIRAMRSSGELQQILVKYGLSDWKK